MRDPAKESQLSSSSPIFLHFKRQEFKLVQFSSKWTPRFGTELLKVYGCAYIDEYETALEQKKLCKEAYVGRKVLNYLNKQTNAN